MTPSRDKRLRKLVELRTRVLDQKRLELAQAGAAQRTAQVATLEASAALVAAHAHRAELSATGAAAERWSDVDRWQTARQAALDAAQTAEADARAKVELARRRVIAAQTDVASIEALLERILTAERKAEDRIEQKASDELSSVRVAARNASQAR